MLPTDLAAPRHAAPDTDGPPRGLAILGSTGSIGQQALEVAALFPGRLRVRALTAHRSWEALAAQARAVRPDVVVLADDTHLADLREALADVKTTEGRAVEVRGGDEALEDVARMDAADVVLTAVVGACGVRPTLAAVRAGKAVALANKEALVVAGALVEQAARASGASVLPVDSEHSALFQSLQGEAMDGVERLTLTASGGPFLRHTAEQLAQVTRADALQHPNWDMGAKISIDSATLMNKGLEVIEARWLFGLGPDRLDVVVHPQSIVHSLVTFRDGSTKAQLGVPDMKVPIQYALTYPARWPAPHERLDLAAVGRLDFEAPDHDRFPALGLALGALRAGGAAPAVLNAANEAAVALFLDEQIRFQDIAALVGAALDAHAVREADALDLAALLAADAEARRFVTARVGAHGCVASPGSDVDAVYTLLLLRVSISIQINLG